jgi:ankyrin repeat protein
MSSARLEGHQMCLELNEDDNTLLNLIDVLPNEAESVAFKESLYFHHVAGPVIDQSSFYKIAVKPVVEKALQGYNGTIIAFGPSGSGKTYTLSGIAGSRGKGGIERATEQILNCIRRSRSGTVANLVVMASFCLIHREIVSDLLLDRSADITSVSSESLLDSSVVEPKDGLEIMDGEVIGLSQHVIRTSKEVEALLLKGNQQRCTIVERRETEDLSPFDDESETLRSAAAHTIFSLSVEHAEMSNSFAPISGTLMFVDMAASEALLTLTQPQAWNTSEDLSPRRSKLSHGDASLHAFVRVIHTLKSNAEGTITQTVPYRNSALTSLLRESLGGNCNTCFICNVSPNASEYRETKHALEIAQAATAIKNTANRRDLAEHALMSAYLREMRQKYRIIIVREDDKDKAQKCTAKANHDVTDVCGNKEFIPVKEGVSGVHDKPTNSQGTAIQAANALAEAAIQSDEDDVGEVEDSHDMIDNAKHPGNERDQNVDCSDSLVSDKSSDSLAEAGQEEISGTLAISESMTNLLKEKSTASVVDMSVSDPTTQLSNDKFVTISHTDCTEVGMSNSMAVKCEGNQIASSVNNDDQVYPFSVDEDSDEYNGTAVSKQNKIQSSVTTADLANVEALNDNRPTKQNDNHRQLVMTNGNCNLAGTCDATEVADSEGASSTSGVNGINSGEGITAAIDKSSTQREEVLSEVKDLEPTYDNDQDAVPLQGAENHEPQMVAEQANNSTTIEDYDFGVERLIEAMRRPGSGVPRTFHGTKEETNVHRAKDGDVLCSGASLVVWVWDHVEGIQDGQESEKLCQHLLDEGIIFHSEGSSVFANADTLFYYIRKPKTAPMAWGVVASESGNTDTVSGGSERVHSAQRKDSATKIQDTGLTLRECKDLADQKDTEESMLEDFVPEDEDVVVSYSPRQQRTEDHGDKVKDETDESGLVRHRGINLSELINSTNEKLHPLHQAAANGERSGVLENLVLMCGVDLRDSAGRTAAMYAIVGKQIRCLNLLLRCGADVNTTDKAGNTLLLWAVYGGNHDGAASLLKNGALVTIPDRQGCTALHWATRLNNPKCLELLLKHSREAMNRQDRSGLTALHWAVAQDKGTLVRLLLKHNADPCVIDSDGRTVADYAIVKQAVSSLKVLLDHQPDLIRQRGTSGWTPLHLASSQQSVECLQILLSVAGYGDKKE